MEEKEIKIIQKYENELWNTWVNLDNTDNEVAMDIASDYRSRWYGVQLLMGKLGIEIDTTMKREKPIRTIRGEK